MANSCLTDLLPCDELDDDECPFPITSSEYFSNDSFIEFCGKHRDDFRVVSLNIQSLNAKFGKLTGYLEYLSRNRTFLDAICIQEATIADDVASSFNIDGYQMIFKPKSASAKGGLCIYLREDLKYNIIDFPKYSPDVWECQFIEVCGLPGDRKARLGNIYFPPNATKLKCETFVSELSDILQEISKSKGFIGWCGDFNLDLLKLHDRPNVRLFFDMVLSENYLPKITRPTRIAGKSFTLIDNFFCRFSELYMRVKCGILWDQISDHKPYFLSWNVGSVKTRPPKHIQFRKTSVENMANFATSLQSKLDSSNYIDPSPDACPISNYAHLQNILMETRDSELPLVKAKFSRKKHKIAPWMTDGIMQLIRKKDKLYKVFNRTPLHSNRYKIRELELSSYQRVIRREIDAAKENYYSRCFTKYANDIKKTWQTIGSLIQKSKSGISSYPSKFFIDNKSVTDTNTIAEQFNKFFINIGPKLATEIGNSPCSFDSYLTEPVPPTFEFEPVSERNVSDAIKRLSNKTSFGFDEISSKLLKISHNALLCPLTTIINQCLKSGTFPDQLKVARVIPVFKKGENFLLDNYRPISLLPSMSKIFERIIYDQIFEYFTDNGLFASNQYGFRRAHSTELAASEILDRVINSLDVGKLSVAIYLDLSKAFDTLDHNILISKFRYYGLKDSAVKMIVSYLEHRQQYVDFNGTCSSKELISTGVPQGSILGPLMFLVYINDLIYVSNKFSAIMYADDTSLISELENFGSNHLCQSSNINAELAKISDWLKANKLSLNVKKTKFMIFRGSHEENHDFSLKIENTSLEKVKAFSFLGLTINDELTWKDHVHSLAAKVARSIGLMNKLKCILPVNILLMIYQSFVMSRLNYQILNWGHVSNDQTCRLALLQKKAIRIATKSGFLDHTEPLFKKFKLLKLSDIYALRKLKLYFAFMNDMLPDYFKNTDVIRGANIHSHNTRHGSEIRPPSISHKFAEKSFRYVIFDIASNPRFPCDVTDKVHTHSKFGFRNYCKNYLLNAYSEFCTLDVCYICKKV